MKIERPRVTLTAMTRIGILHDARFKRHGTGPGHPESAERLSAVDAGLRKSGVLDGAAMIEPTSIDLELLERRHDPGYIERLRRASSEGHPIIDVPDCTICRDTYEIALLAAGGTVEAARRMGSGEFDRAFCAVRPPGHHAERDRAMGFCMFNNAALAADVLLQECGLDRVLILDWDVHHGNGTQNTFYDDPRVFYISLHGHPQYLFPGTGRAEEHGRGEGEGSTLNVPLMPGTADDFFREELQRRVLPEIDNFRPDAIILSSGFDAHRDDPVGNLMLSSEMFIELLEDVVKLADRHAGGRVLSVLEGGYNMSVLEECVADHVRVLARENGK